jgi:hypothetical protein
MCVALQPHGGCPSASSSSSDGNGLAPKQAPTMSESSHYWSGSGGGGGRSPSSIDRWLPGWDVFCFLRCSRRRRLHRPHHHAQQQGRGHAALAAACFRAYVRLADEDEEGMPSVGAATAATPAAPAASAADSQRSNGNGNKQQQEDASSSSSSLAPVTPSAVVASITPIPRDHAGGLDPGVRRLRVGGDRPTDSPAYTSG